MTLNVSHEITYTSSSGTVFDLECGTALMTSDSTSLRGWTLSVDATTGLATRQHQDFDTYVHFPDKDYANEFIAETDTDAVNNTPGTLSVDGWELPCIVTAGSIDTWVDSSSAYELTFHSSTSVWRKRTLHHLMPSSGTETGESLDYPYDYEFDYDSPNSAAGERTIKAPGKCLLKIIFFGPCNSPYCRVTAEDGSKSNVYGVESSAGIGERIVIDPTGRQVMGGSIYHVSVTGDKTNLYSSRKRGASGSGSYVFEPMPAGQLEVTWPQSYGIDIEVIEERSALPWT